MAMHPDDQALIDALDRPWTDVEDDAMKAALEVSDPILGRLSSFIRDKLPEDLSHLFEVRLDAFVVSHPVMAKRLERVAAGEAAKEQASAGSEVSES